MEKGRYMLIHNNSNIYRFKYLTEAQRYAIIHLRGNNESYIIVDTKEDKVVNKWSY